MIKSVAVFCGSSTQLSPMFYAEADLFGRKLAQSGLAVVYGGANVGLMGSIADGALAEGGKVIGVIPEMDFSVGIVHAQLSQQVKVKSLAERKAKMLELAEAIVVFPGGLGTLDEATDALVLRLTHELNKPIFFLNLFDFWSPFLESLTVMVEQRMILTPLDGLFAICNTSEELLESLLAGGQLDG